jgi:hypothetical protein
MQNHIQQVGRYQPLMVLNETISVGNTSLAVGVITLA